MKKSDSASIDLSSIARRKMLKAAAVGAGLSALPAARVIAAAITVGKAAPALTMGYCAQESLEKLGLAAALSDAFNVAPQRANYTLRVIGVGTQVPLALSAQYGALAQHCFWQAWLEHGMLQRSPPITIRWAATAGNPLPLNIRVDTGTQTAEVTARAGIYVLTIVPATQRQPAWSALALRKQFSGGVGMKLVAREGGAEVAFPYALFDVQAADA